MPTKKPTKQEESVVFDSLKSFTYDAYTKLMILLRKRYDIIPFCEISRSHEPFLILRHDIDASLETALKMAKTDTNLGIRSTYFVLLSHKLFNLLERDSLLTLREISELGHEIGLHYDVAAYESYGQHLKKVLKSEVRMLETILGRKVFSIACHNVSTMNGKDPFRRTKEYINAYDPRFCENYVSDSCRAWSLKDLSRLLSARDMRVQLLIHPFLWTEVACGRDAILERLFQDVEKRNTTYRSNWLKLWHDSPKARQYDNLIKRAR